MKKNMEKKETVMYIGPTISGVVKQNTVFNNGLPKGLIELQEKMPIVKSLIVSTSQIAEAKNKVQSKGSALNVIYNKVLSYVKGGR